MVNIAFPWILWVSEAPPFWWFLVHQTKSPTLGRQRSGLTLENVYRKRHEINLTITHDASMETIKIKPNVGKYTVPYMDGMGKNPGMS